MGVDGSRPRPGEEASATDPLDDGGCQPRSRELVLYLDGELSEPERLAFETHLVACAVCDRAARLRQRFREAVRTKASGGTPRAPAALRARIALALDAEPPPRAPPALEPAAASAPLRFTRRWLRPVPIAAAGATALGLTAWLWLNPRPSDVVRDIVARHARRLPLEITSNDPRSLEHWLQDKVDFRVKVPPPPRPDLALLGARLSHVRNHSAVYVLYATPESPSHRVSILVFDDPSGELAPPSGELRHVDDRDVWLSNAQGYNVATWKQNEVVYSLVGDHDDDVVELVRASAR